MNTPTDTPTVPDVMKTIKYEIIGSDSGGRTCVIRTHDEDGNQKYVFNTLADAIEEIRISADSLAELGWQQVMIRKTTTIEEYLPNANFYNPETTVCPECKGAGVRRLVELGGVAYGGDDCPDCHGTGTTALEVRQ